MKDSRLEPKMLGIINLSTEELLYEDCIGKINFPNNIGECSVYVYSKEGTIPHFHIIPNNGGGECCVCIYDAVYFNHGSKQMQLNSKQRKELNNWMKEASKINPKLTNWELICTLWDTGNNTSYVLQNKKQPNYKNMNLWRN